MSSYWSEVCSSAEARPLQELLNDLYASGGVLVSRAPVSPNRAFSFFFNSGILSEKLVFYPRPDFGIYCVRNCSRRSVRTMEEVER